MNTEMQRRLTAAIACTLGVICAPVASRAEVAGGVIGCNASGTKQEGGAVIGAVLGGIAGNNLAKNDRGTGTVIGATAGAAAGSFVGCQMQKSDARKTAATQERPVVIREEAPVIVERPVSPDERRFVPPGLAKKPYGMPPGQARKYGVGERLPGAYVQESRYDVAEPARYRLRQAPAGYRWVMVDHDAYLVRSRTGVVTEVARGPS